MNRRGAFVNIAGIIFILFGISLFVLAANIKLPLDLKKAELLFKYGASIGSIIGGIFMLLRKESGAAGHTSTKHIPQIVKIK